MVQVEHLDSDAASSAGEEDGDALVKKASGPKGGGAQARTRSASRRRKIRKEVKAKAARARDTWALQQQLLGPGTPAGLMDAALKMLEPEGYKAVVEERALEGVCGFPSCSKPAIGVAAGKRWKVDPTNREVYAAQDIGQFCSFTCLRESGTFALRLEPDPAYCRPASAVAASRSAAAEATEAAKAPAPKAAAEAAPNTAGDGAVEEKAATTTADAGEAPPATPDAGADPAPKAKATKSLPAVRRNAVVRFSRVAQTCNVHYGDYDGGGALPDVPSVTSAAEDGNAASAAAVASNTAEDPKKGPTTRADLERLLRAPILEKDVTAVSSADAQEEVGGNSEKAEVPTASTTPEESPESSNRGLEPELDNGAKSGANKGILRPSVVADADPGLGPDKEKRKLHFADAEPQIEEEIEHEEQGGDDSAEEEGENGVRIERGDDVLEDLFDWDATFPDSWSGSAFVRAWGVLSSWLTQIAKDTLRGSRQPGSNGCFDDGRQGHRGRRSLLAELINERVPGELTFLCPRLEVVVAAFSVHQTLPSVAEFKLYDLLAALLLRAVFRAEVRRRALDASDDHERLLQHRVNVAARALQVSEEELASLDAIFGI